MAAGAVEIALGALLGFPFAMAVDGGEGAQRWLRRVGVRSVRRLRQLHLDLIVMGVLLVAAGTAVPGLPLWVVLAVGVGGWTNALLFAPLAYDEDVQGRAWYRSVTLLSFIAVAAGWAGVAVVAVSRL